MKFQCSRTLELIKQVNIFHKGGKMLTISLLVIFIGQFISSNLLNNEKLTYLLRWNPFNMTNLTRQYYNYTTYSETSHLLNFQLLLGTITYTLLFTIIGYLIFRKNIFNKLGGLMYE